MKNRIPFLRLAIPAIVFALSLGLLGCGENRSNLTQVVLNVAQGDKSVSSPLNSAIITPTGNTRVAVYIEVTAADINPPLEYYFSPDEISANSGVLSMMVPSGPARTFIIQVLSFDMGGAVDQFPGAYYRPSQPLVYDLTGQPLVANVNMAPVSTATVEGKIYDSRTGDVMPLNVPCARPDVRANLVLTPFSGGVPVQVTVNSGGAYLIQNVPTDVPITLTAIDNTTGASSSTNFQIPTLIASSKQNIVLDGAKPLVISPTSGSVFTNEMIEFFVDGGIPPYSILITQDSSNASITQTSPVSAEYTSGNMGGGAVDIITAGDSCNDYIPENPFAVVVVDRYPLSIAPTNQTIQAYQTIPFVGSGGDGIYSWSIIGGTCVGSVITGGGLYTPDQNGNCTDIIQLSDYSGNTPATTTVNVLLGNMAPTITNLPYTASSHWGQPGSFDVDGNDNLNIPPNNLSWSLGTDNCSFTPGINIASGLVSWTCGGVETCSVSVILTDDGIPARNDSDTLTIDCSNNAPIITSTAPGSASEGVLYSYAVACTDTNSDLLSLGSGLTDTCGGSVADNGDGTGSYTFTPIESQGGLICDVGVVCTDTQDSDETTDIVLVAETNQNPTIAVNCPASVGEDSPTSCTLTPSDADVPSQTPSCALDPSSTCTGITIVGCSTVDVPPQGEGSPASCSIVVNIQDDYTPPGTGQTTSNITIINTNSNPTVAVNCPPGVDEDAGTSCALTPADTDLPPQSLNCSIDGSSTCTGLSTVGCTSVNIPSQGEAAPASCSVVVNISDNFAPAGTGQGSSNIAINEVNSNPTVAVDCPPNVYEDTGTSCAVTAADSDLPAQSINCSIDGSSTCTGLSMVGCTSVDVPPQGEGAPASCSVIVNVGDNFVPAGAAQSSDSLTIDEVNQNPSVAVNCPSNMSEDTPVTCPLTATDPDFPSSLSTDPGYVTCSINATSTCTGASIMGCVQVDVPPQGELTGGGSCSVVVDVTDGWMATGQGNSIMAIDETNQAPSIAVNCPSNLNEDTGGNCTLTPTDPDTPNINPSDPGYYTCSLNAATTCSSALLTGCSDVSVGAQGETSAPGSCDVVVDITDGWSTTAQGMATITLNEVNMNPYWSVTPETIISVLVNRPYVITNGAAKDDDLPNSGLTDPGFVACGIQNNTCSFAISAPSSGWGSVNFTMAFVSGNNAESCTFDEVVHDGLGGQVSQTVSVVVTKVWYVDATAAGANNGNSWADAFTSIQTAMSTAVSGDMVWVRQGVFQASLLTDESVITIPSGVQVYGGFVGGETSLEDRGEPPSIMTTLDGQNSNCHVVIGNSNIILDGFEVINGRAVSSAYCTYPSGGGICNAYAYDMAFKNVKVAYNYAYVMGGGISNLSASLAMDNSIISYNSSHGGGGGVFNSWSNMTISNSNISYNDASYNSGGGFYNTNSTFEMSLSTAENNVARYSGGAIYNNNTDMRISTSEFFNNGMYISGDYTNADGGAIYNTGSRGTIEWSLFSGNHVQASGYMSFSFGGAISNYLSPVYINHNSFSYNSAQYGGAISNYQAAPLISNNIFSYNYANAGGAITNMYYATPEIKLSQFNQNYAYHGGGAVFNGGASPIISDSVFYKNSSYSDGGAIANVLIGYSYIYPVITNCQFNQNDAYNSGGAIFNYYSDAEINHSSFTNNSCYNYNCKGGAIAAYRDYSYIANSTLEYNLAGKGGAIFVDGGYPTISNDIIKDNQATDGGGIYNYRNPDVYIENSIILGNDASNRGGGIFNNSNGGGLDCPHVLNTVIANNTAYTGAGLFTYDNDVFVTNSTITGNVSSYGSGAGIYVQNSSPYYTYSVIVKSSIVWGNIAPGQDPEIRIPAGSAATIIRNSDIGKYVYDSYYHISYLAPYPGVGNIYNDPLFISTSEYNFHLKPYSQCRNLGSPLPGMIDPDGTRNDMGAFGGPSTTHFDTDYDGMEDWWELLYGLNPLNPSDATLNPDGDPYTNLQEFNNHTDPLVADP